MEDKAIQGCASHPSSLPHTDQLQHSTEIKETRLGGGRGTATKNRPRGTSVPCEGAVEDTASSTQTTLRHGSAPPGAGGRVQDVYQ